MNPDTQITLSKSNQVITGKTFDGSLYARMQHEDGRPYHTFRTQTVLADGDHITFKDCTFINSAGPGEKVGQAIALYLDGDDIHLENCTLSGHQDTLFMAPLPPKEYEKDGFLGPKQFTPRTDRTFYFKNCVIEGGIDFIFGGATAYFDDCEFRSVEPGFVFAPCTPEHVETGFVARNCRFTFSNEKAVPEGSCYIARPWRDYAKVTIEHCFLDRHIAAAGWDDWGKEHAHDTVRFVESDSYGPGAVMDQRPAWVIIR